MNNRRILLVDDENDILDLLHHCLELEGYSVKSTTTGKESLQLAETFQPDLILLDYNMPDIDGITICTSIRKKLFNLNPIIIFFSSDKKWETHLKGYECGADDFIVKPIRTKILVNKVKVWLNRFNLKTIIASKNKSITMDTEKYTVSVNGIEIYMRNKEFKILRLLMSKPNHIFGKDQIMKNVWDDDVIVGFKNIDVHIKKLRDKIGKDKIKTLKGIGYKFID